MTFPILPSNAPSTGYNLDRSLRFRASASAYLSRTTGTATNQNKWTWSGWVKRGTLGTVQVLMNGYQDDSNLGNINFVDDSLQVARLIGGSVLFLRKTNAVYRDPSAWYHFVIVFDNANATVADRVQIYVNGVLQTYSISNDPSTSGMFINANSTAQRIGRSGSTASPFYFDGYLADVNFIDGQALTPASFGETNALTGVWQPKAYTGTYGTNGFYLDFEDTSSVAALGTDDSGNGNNWTVNNVSLTAGVTYDSMTDVPTLTSATTANYAVLNPLVLTPNSTTFANGNLKFTGNAAGAHSISASSVAMPAGKWYAEFTLDNVGSPFAIVGLLGPNEPYQTMAYLGQTATSYGYDSGGRRTNNATVVTGYGATFTTGDIIALSFDTSTGTLIFYKNGVSQGTAYSGLTNTYFMGVDGYNGGSWSANFGQRPFTYTPPTGFVALNAFNLPTSTILKGNTVMDATLYTGNGSTQTITNAAGFQSDFIWIKNRSAANSHQLTDSVRGVTKYLFSDATLAEETRTTQVTAITSTGFSLGSGAAVNTSSNSYVGWQWQAGQGTTSSNTNGSITSTVSVNPTAGFSIITYTGNSVSGATVGHGLGVAPKFWVIKRRDGTGSWKALSTVTGSVLMGELNSQTTWASPGAPMTTAPTSSVITLDASGDRNGTGQTYVIYAFAEIEGFSKITYFDGNGSTDGPFVYTGFRPKFTLSKDIEGGSYWAMMDSSRSPFNVANALLNADLSNAESTSAIYDYLSDGIKLRSATNNQNAHKHIMISFAENPFKNSLAR